MGAIPWRFESSLGHHSTLPSGALAHGSRTFGVRATNAEANEWKSPTHITKSGSEWIAARRRYTGAVLQVRRLSLSSIIGISSIIAVTFAAHGGVLRNGFVGWDDGYLITENVNIRSINPLTLRHIFTTYDPELYIPLTFLSYQLDHLLWGLNPVGFHLTNLILHTLNAVLVFVLMVLLLRSGFDYAQPDTHTMTRSWIPLFVALLFAVHPLNVEAVAWAAARKDLLSGFFFLLSVCGYLKWVESVTLRKIFSHHDKWYFFSILSFLLGLLAKVSIAPLPLVILLIDWFLTRRCRVRVLRSLFPYFLLSIVFGVIAVFGKTRNVASTSLLESLLLGAKSTIFYIQKILLPSNLSVLYPYTDPISFGNPDLLFPFLLIVVLLTLAWIARRNFPLFTFTVAWFVLLLLPSFTAFRKGDDIELDLYFASDRYAYLPSIGIVLFLVSLGISLCSNARTHLEERFRQKIATGLTCAIAVFFGFLSFRHAQTWNTTETLFQNVIRAYPNSHIAYNNVGLFLQGRGDIAGAIDHYRKAILIRPTGRTYYNLGLAYIVQGEKEKAMEANRTAIEINPRHARAHLNLGGLLLENGKITEALQELSAAIAINPDLSLAHFNRGVAYEQLGKLYDAEKAYNAALEKDPDDIETLVSLVALFVRKRQLDDALVLLQRAISLQPHHPRYESLLLEIARLQGKRL